MAKRKSGGLSWRRLGYAGAAWLTPALLALLCSGTPLRAADSVPARSPSSNTTTVALEYQETSNAFLFRNVPIECRSAPFPKEPAPVSGPVVRGVLKFGDNPSNAIPFVWQTGAKKLFLGLNRNPDWTGDPAGMFSARVLWSSEPTFLIQMFTNVHLSFPATSGGAPMLVDLRFCLDTARRPGQPLCNAALRSSWQGKVTLEGHDWQVGLVQNYVRRPRLLPARPNVVASVGRVEAAVHRLQRAGWTCT